MIIIFCLVLNRVCGPTRDLSEAKVYGIDGNIMPLGPFLPALAKLTKLPLRAMHGETAERLYEWVKDHGIQQVSTDYMWHEEQQKIYRFELIISIDKSDDLDDLHFEYLKKPLGLWEFCWWVCTDNREKIGLILKDKSLKTSLYTLKTALLGRDSRLRISESALLLLYIIKGMEFQLESLSKRSVITFNPDLSQRPDEASVPGLRYIEIGVSEYGTTILNMKELLFGQVTRPFYDILIESEPVCRLFLDWILKNCTQLPAEAAAQIQAN